MLGWIARGLIGGRITMRWPHGAPESELAALAEAERPWLAEGRVALGERAGALRRSVHVRHIDCGSDGSEEWEIQALWNPYYDIQRLGFFLTASPRHADLLVVTGPVTSAMRSPLERTWEVMPEPKALVAVGAEACGQGVCAGDRDLAAEDPPTAGGVDRVLEVDVYVPGCPPPPIAIMQGLMLAAGLLRDGDSRGREGRRVSGAVKA